MCGCKWKISVDDAAMPCSSSTSGLREVAGPGFLRRGCKRGQRKTQPAGGDKVPNNRAVKKNKMSCVLTVFVTKSVTGSLQRGTQSSVATEQLTQEVGAVPSRFPECLATLLPRLLLWATSRSLARAFTKATFSCPDVNPNLTPQELHISPSSLSHVALSPQAGPAS